MRSFCLTEDKAIVFSGGTTEEFEGHYEEDDTDAGTGEHALGGDMP
jgi:hypothetical protein